MVDTLRDVPGFHFINGDAGLQLGTGELSVPNRLGPVGFNLGIIAGNQSINWILSSFIPGSDDGKVSIDNTMVEGMNDHIELPATHPFMMENEDVIHQVIYYLENGIFERGSNYNQSGGSLLQEQKPGSSVRISDMTVEVSNGFCTSV